MGEADQRSHGTRVAWLDPTCLGLGLAGWAVPGFGSIIAVCAIVCGLAAVLAARRTGRRVDWMSVVGLCAGGAHLVVSGVLILAAAN